MPGASARGVSFNGADASAFEDPVVIVDPANPQNNVAARIEAHERDAFVAAAKEALATITVVQGLPGDGEAVTAWKELFGENFSIAGSMSSTYTDTFNRDDIRRVYGSFEADYKIVAEWTELHRPAFVEALSESRRDEFTAAYLVGWGTTDFDGTCGDLVRSFARGSPPSGSARPRGFEPLTFGSVAGSRRRAKALLSP